LKALGRLGCVYRLDAGSEHKEESELKSLDKGWVSFLRGAGQVTAYHGTSAKTVSIMARVSVNNNL